jgi:hypothetical protein
VPLNSKGIYSGNIVSGDAFGISVGTSLSSAEKALISRKIDFVYDVPCDFYLARLMDCHRTSGSEFKLYHLEEAFRRGTVIVVIKQNRVFQIYWNLSLLPPMDS